MFANSVFFRRFTGIFLSILVAFAAGCASAPQNVEVSEVHEISATVVAVNQAQRLMTIRGPEGNEVTLELGPEVRNLAQVSAGDTMRVVYEQAYFASLTDAEVPSPAVPVTVGTARSELGDMPAGAIGSMVTMSVRIESIGENGDTVTFTDAGGEIHAIRVRFEESKEFARGLNPGDIVEITSAQAFAILIEPPTQ
jgi:hypothetical protein